VKLISGRCASFRRRRDQIGVLIYVIKKGDTGLMLFRIDQHGYLLNVIGQPRKAKQYLIGNPMTASRMTRHDIRAALYAPLRILIYEDLGGHSFVEYDLPSSLFCQFGNSQIAEIGKELDRKILDVINKSDTPD
jgi:uncharacterized protein (DUF302 family)